MSDLCDDEQVSCHHLGNGHGPVQDQESVVIAIFQSTPQHNGKVTAEAFPTRQLVRGELSVARLEYTSVGVFKTEVLARGETSGQIALGCCCARVTDIRQKVLIAPDANQLDKLVRAVCVLDKVVAGDHEGHAALKYAELPGPISDKQLGKLRSIIREDLAAQFQQIANCDQIWNVAS